MSVDFGINPSTNDIAYKNGKIICYNSSNEVVQRVKTRLRRCRGEWFLQIDAGLPYFNGEMLGGKNTQYVLMIIRSEILQTEGVQDVEKISIDYNNVSRKAVVTAIIVVDSATYTLTEEI